MIRHDIDQYFHDVASVPPPIQLNTRLHPPVVQATVLVASNGHSGVAPALPAAAPAGALPALVLATALLLALLFSWLASREVLRLRRVLGRYRAFVGITRTEYPVPAELSTDIPGR
ncbi:MAG TPA: hypothetical protein VNX47_11640 [Nevskia sp.]|nr:hypothetical protein [Nevskia sp.]